MGNSPLPATKINCRVALEAVHKPMGGGVLVYPSYEETYRAISSSPGDMGGCRLYR